MVDTAVLRFSVLCRNFSLPVSPLFLLVCPLALCLQTSWCLRFIVCAAQTVLPIYTLFRFHSAQETQHKPVTIKVAVGGKSYILYSGSAGFESQWGH